MYCGKCGKENKDNNSYCNYCGESLDSADNSKNKHKISIKAFIIVFLCIGICSAAGFALTRIFLFNAETTSSSGSLADDIEIEFHKSTSSQNTELIQSQAPSVDTFDPGKLYRPDESYFCDQYTRYISGNFEGQGYAKMRFGPSKSKYNVVGQIDNGNVVTVQTLSVDGWTLIYYNGKEGWVRTDFLFESYDACFYKERVYPDVELCGYEAFVDVTGEYDGEPLNMRGGLSREYELITTVPDGATVEVWGQSSSDSSWTYVKYNGHSGWVLTKYLIINGVGDKPVLYLYPENTSDVKVQLELSDKMFFTCTYPEYNRGWNVTAYPDGKLINHADNKEYSYLYWELGGQQNYSFDKGFVIKGSDTAAFLQNILSEIGLTPEEYNEFIVYWLPKMQNNEYNIISFQTDEYTENVKLRISPEPDSILRVFMAYKPSTEYVELPPQSFEEFSRDGFTVVEWGGAEVR